ncbi:MAG: carboxypeptidase-like regulatory domain-containing protein [Nitrososphaerota archaeon]
MRGSSGPSVASFALLAFSLLLALGSLVLLTEPASAQPRWSFRANVTGTLYPGEEGTILVSVMNTECVNRVRMAKLDYTRHDFVRNVEEPQIEAIRARLEELKGLNLIGDYLIAENSSQLFGSVVRFNLTVFVYDYCTGRNAQVQKARVWFTWPGYGRSYSSEVVVGRTLPPFDVLGYVVTGSTSGFRIDLSFAFKVPKDIDSELLVPSTPVVELDAVVTKDQYTFGGPFGLREVVVTGSVRIEPFRTFELLITDSYGERPLPYATLRLQAHIYPFSLELRTGPDGRLLIRRLPDQYSYRAYVLFQTPVVEEPITVAVLDVEARGLAASGAIRTELYTVRVSVRDAKGKPVQGADVTLSPIEVIYAKEWRPVSVTTTGEGKAEFPLISRGNYSVSVRRLGIEVFSSSLYVGYHPTYGFREPNLDAVARLDDLKVSVVDGKGRPVPANVEVMMSPSGEVLASLTAPDGKVLLAQIPVIDYRIRVSVKSSLGTALVSEATARPGDGEGVTVRMPLFRVRLEARTADGRPLPEGTVRVDGASFELVGGSIALDLVPEGPHRISVTFRGAEVFTGELVVADDQERVLPASVYRLDLSFVDAEGNPVDVSWRASGAGLRKEGTGRSVTLDLVPDVQLELSVTYRFLNTSADLLRLTERVSSLAKEDRLVLPLARLRVSVVWDYGAPFSGSISLTYGNASVTGQVRNGEFSTGVPVPFGNYSFRVADGFGNVLSSGVVHHRGETIRITVRTVRIAVDVIDLFGTPVPGANVRVLLGPSPYRMGITDLTGRVEFTGLPERLSPYVVEVTVRDYVERKMVSASPTFTVPYVRVLDSLLSLLELGIVAVAVLAASAALALYSIRRPRS